MEIFQDIVSTLNLGNLAAPVERVMGGYLHKMYRLETDLGKFAVKLLNPEIMKRHDVFENYRIAESLERTMQKTSIPIVPALEINSKKMQYINDQYFYVFDWVDGKTLSSQEINETHCEIIGAYIAKIHKVEQADKPFVKKQIESDWDFYIKLSNERCPEITGLLRDNRELLYSLQNSGISALRNMSAISCSCHIDMDSKNVLWVDGKPKIIDLECLAYANPYINLFQLALDWSGFERNNIDFRLLTHLIMAYMKEYGKISVDWEVLYYSNLTMIEWLEYNVKRALMIECSDEEERQLGVTMVKHTVEQLVYYNLIKCELLSALDEITK